MFKEAKAAVSGPGRLEGLTPFQGWLVERADDCADDQGGDVERGAYFLLCGRHLLTTDDRGFWYVGRFPTREAAAHAFQLAIASLYDDDDDDDDL